MTTFALIHGGGHGGWCWNLLIAELEARGHEAVAPSMPTDDPTAGAAEYAALVLDALRPTEGNDIVVVGHSLGGLTVPLVAAQRPVRHMVFLAAMVPAPGEIYGDLMVAKPWALTSRSGDAVQWDPHAVTPARTWEAALQLYYHDVPEPLARWAWPQLRPQSVRLFSEPSPLRIWPDTPSTYILMTDDRSVDPEFSRWLAHERLGVTALELPGSHSPFLARPGALADLLTAIPYGPQAAPRDVER